MANDILVLADHVGGQLSDTTLELVGKAKELAGSSGGPACMQSRWRVFTMVAPRRLTFSRRRATRDA